ncbi:hypothetical protein [Streptomyces nigrescens]
MDWGTPAATPGGGGIAISGTVLADYLRHRHERDRGAEARRRAVYIEFISAAGWGEWDGRDRCALCEEAGAGGG